MTYFYARVSSKEQSLERQLKVAEEFKDIDKIYADKESGKNFQRAEYQRMKSELVKGDTVIVKELDRLGRDKELVKKEIEWYRENGIRLIILNIPSTTIDFKDQAWIQDMVNNILIEVLASMAEEERKKIRARQREGIDAMPVVKGKHISKKTGKGFGVAPNECPKFDKYYSMVKAGKIGVRQAISELGIGCKKWYSMCKYKEAV